MYFLRLESLKRELAARTISERKALPYLLWLGGLTTLATLLPSGHDTTWDIASAVAGVAIFVGGTLVAYRCNGGPAGQDFLIRYLCLNWVVGLRLFLLLGMPTILAAVYAEELLFGEVAEETTAVGALSAAVFEVALYWRISVHIRGLSSSSGAA